MLGTFASWRAFPLSALAFVLSSTAFAAPPRADLIRKSEGDRAAFIENKGQWDGRVQFLSQTPGVNEWITSEGAVFDFHRFVPSRAAGSGRRPQGVTQGHVLKMTFVDAKATQLSGLKEMPGKTNFLIGNDAAKWATQVRSFAEVRAEQPYDGIAVRYYFDHGSPRYDVLVQPGADPAQVHLKIEGANGIHVLPNGNLAIETSLGRVEQRGLAAYQEVGTHKTPVPCRMISDGDTVRFDTGNYDPTRPLVIDPLVFSTFTGGSNGYVFVSGVGSAPNGDAIIAGYTDATNFPATAGAYQTTGHTAFDGYVAEYTVDGTKAVFSSYLGGSLATSIYGMTVDAAGDPIVVGYTTSNDFPVTAGAFQTNNTAFPFTDASFVTKLNPTGTGLIFSTYLAGTDSGPGGGSSGQAVALDGAGDVLVGGIDGCNNFPVSANAFQKAPKSSENAYIVKLNPTGTKLIYGSLIGGTGYDSVSGLAVDKSGYAYICGRTTSKDFPVTSSAYQKTNQATLANAYNSGAFVAKFNSTASGLEYSTYLSGSNDMRMNAIAVNAANEAIVCGYTYATNFPTTSGVIQPTYEGGNQAQGFLAVLNAGGSGLALGTFFGGHGYCDLEGITLDSAGDVIVCGAANSGDFPTTAGAFQTQNQAGLDSAVLSSLNPTLSSLKYSTLLGGEYGYSGDEASSVALTPSGEAIITGTASSLNFPTTPNAWRSAPDGYGEVFVSGITMAAGAQTTLIDFAIQPTIIAGQTGYATAYLNGPAASNTIVQLTSGAGISMQSIVTVSANKDYSPAYYSAANVASPTNVLVTAKLGPTTLSRTIEVVPAAITSIIVPSAVLQQTGYWVTVNLSAMVGYANGPQSVTFTTTGPLSAPASVSIQAGESYVAFNVTAGSVSAPTAATLKATFGSVSRTANVTVEPGILSFGITPGSVVGGNPVTGVVKTYVPVGGNGVGAQLVIVENISPLLRSAYTTQIPYGATSVNIPITTLPVASNTVASIQIGSGNTFKTASVTLTPPPLSGLQIQPNPVTGGTSVTGTATLNGQASASGDVITLSSNNAAATMSGTATILSGLTFVNFTIQTKPVVVKTIVTIKATFGGSTVSQTLTLNP